MEFLLNHTLNFSVVYLKTEFEFGLLPTLRLLICGFAQSLSNGSANLSECNRKFSCAAHFELHVSNIFRYSNIEGVLSEIVQSQSQKSKSRDVPSGNNSFYRKNQDTLGYP